MDAEIKKMFAEADMPMKSKKEGEVKTENKEATEKKGEDKKKEKTPKKKDQSVDSEKEHKEKE